MVLRNRVKEIRLENKMKQIDLERITGIARSQISRIESHVIRNTKVETAIILSRGLRRSVEEIFYFTKDDGVEPL